MPRTLTMVPVVSTLILGLAVAVVWLYSLVPALKVPFSWQVVRPMGALGFCFGVFMCLALSVFYTHSQWNRDQVLNEQLKRNILQNQFDSLKRQLNPHFLFNSLNSLSQLIGDDRARAEQFVDNLARVYRYLLQTGPDATAGGVVGRLVPLQAELAFIRTYAKLLRARYGESLHIKLWVPPAFSVRYLPHLSLQAVVDHAIQHNVMLPKKPLVIAITPDQEGVLRIQHNRQPKAIRVEAHHAGLEQLRVKYDLLCGECVRVEQTEQFVAVLLPLFSSEKQPLNPAAQ
jgi:LytS/YehU family sensor histidine kinase